MKRPVYHFKSGREAWRIGFWGCFVSIVGSISVSMLSIVVVWVIINNNVLSVFCYKKEIVSIAIGVFVFVLFGYGRDRTRFYLEKKYILHQFSHNMRDFQTDFYRKMHSNVDYCMQKHLCVLCDNISSYFKLVTREKTIGVSIRLATKSVDEEEKCSILYKTYARSSYFSKKREETSEPISICTGIPNFLYTKKDQGVLVYLDIDKAKELNVYVSTKNDKLYPNDIKSMIVAPLNAFAGKDHDMIGIIYITSGDVKTFKASHTDSALFFADMMAYFISNIIEYVRINNKCRTKKVKLC